jgi:hypothetical protein
MDIALLVNFLAPYLPFLTGLGRKMVEKGAEKLGEQGATEFLPQGKRIWEKLHPKVHAKAAAQKAAEDVAQNTNNTDAVSDLQYQLKNILEAPENTALAAEVAEILTEIENYRAGAIKFNVYVKDSQVGAIGDRATVTMNVDFKPQI